MKELLGLLVEWLKIHGFRMVLIIIMAWGIRRILQAAVSRFERRYQQQSDAPSEAEKRAKTLGGIIRAVITVVVYVAAMMMIVGEFGVQIGPLLAGAGIAGLAVGFGAQTLVKDVINGFFILLEDQIRVGDVVNVGGLGGLVEAISLRTTRLRDLEGRVHIIPNGSIEVATNLTREWSRALIDVGVAYKEDIDKVIEIMKEVGDEMKQHPIWGLMILEPITVLGLDSFGDSSVNIRAFFKTVPLKQWDVGREYRRRLKRAFDQRGIEMPFPHRTIYMGEAERKGRLRVEAVIRSSGNNQEQLKF